MERNPTFSHVRVSQRCNWHIYSLYNLWVIIFRVEVKNNTQLYNNKVQYATSFILEDLS